MEKAEPNQAVTVSELFSNGNNIRSEASNFNLMVESLLCWEGSDEASQSVEIPSRGSFELP